MTAHTQAPRGRVFQQLCLAIVLIVWMGVLPHSASAAVATSVNGHPNAPAALRIATHTASVALIHGSTTSYTITLTNSGASAARGLSWSDSPSGLDITHIATAHVSANSDAGAASAHFMGFENITIAANSNISYTVMAKVTGAVGEQASHTASVLGANCISSEATACSSTVKHRIVSALQRSIGTNTPSPLLSTGLGTQDAVTIPKTGAAAAQQASAMAEPMDARWIVCAVAFLLVFAASKYLPERHGLAKER